MAIETFTDVVQMMKSGVPEDGFGGSVTRYYGRMLVYRSSLDCATDFIPDGWQHFTTGKDAPDFGVWVNREKRITLQVLEGSVNLVVAHTDHGYNESIRELFEHPESQSHPQDRKSFLIDIPQCPDFDEDCATMSLHDVHKCIRGVCGVVNNYRVFCEPLNGVCGELQRRQALAVCDGASG